MTITVKDVFCGGALITSDDLVGTPDSSLNCGAAVVVECQKMAACGASVPIYRSASSGAMVLGSSQAFILEGFDHSDDCTVDPYACGEDFEDCDCDVRSTTEFVATPIPGLQPGDKMRIATL